MEPFLCETQTWLGRGSPFYPGKTFCHIPVYTLSTFANSAKCRCCNWERNGAKIGVWLELTKMCCTSAMVKSIIVNAWRNIKVCVNSKLRWPAVNLVKLGNVFVIRTLYKVDSAGRVTLLPGTTFLHINGAMICINVSIFLRIFQKLAGQYKHNFRSLAGHFLILDGLWPLGSSVILSSVTWCGRNNNQYVYVIGNRICQLIAI